MLNDFTLKQLLIAAGRARNMKSSTICLYVGVTEAYLSKLSKNPLFENLILMMKGMDVDKDNLEFINIGTLYCDVARHLYNAGEKIKHE